MTLGVFQVENLDERRADHVSFPTFSTTTTVNKNPNAINTTANYAAALDDKKKILLIREKKACHATSTREFKRGRGGQSKGHQARKPRVI